MIYTSYYGKLKELKQNGFHPISISVVLPKWIRFMQGYKDLAPSYKILRLGVKDYIRVFSMKLNELSAKQVEEEIYAMTPEGKKPVLLCYEKFDKQTCEDLLGGENNVNSQFFCHRHLVSKWLNENGVKCEEALKPNTLF